MTLFLGFLTDHSLTDHKGTSRRPTLIIVLFILFIDHTVKVMELS